MRAFWVFIILVAAMVGWFGATPRSLASSRTVNDVSWPNCGKPLPKAAAGIVGITGGLANHPNPCLAYEAGRYSRLSVYVNTGYPGAKRAQKFQHSPKACRSKDNRCLAYNYGYNSGLYDIDQSLASGVIAKSWWLDVETENSWDNSVEVNRASLQGTIDVLSRLVGMQNIGFYSFPGQWNLLTGKWLNHYPVWVATGSTKFSDALAACATSFTDGPTIYGQYTQQLDVNYLCR